jgi:hypothetical protein
MLMACAVDVTDNPSTSTTLDELQGYGAAYVCLSSSTGQNPTEVTADPPITSWSVEGTLVAQGSPDWGEFLLIACEQDPQRTFEIIDAEGVSWYIGWTLSLGDGKVDGLDPTLDNHSRVTATIAFVDGGAAAFALVDEDGLAFVVDGEGVTDRMDGSAFPGLGISWGVDYGRTVHGECGQQASQLVLEGDGTAELYAGDKDGLSIDGQAFHARALSVYRDPLDDSCPVRRAFVLYR